MASPMISENMALAARFQVERVTGIEPALSAWEADVLPLNYTRTRAGRPVAAYRSGLRRPVRLAQTSYRTRRGAGHRLPARPARRLPCPLSADTGRAAGCPE